MEGASWDVLYRWAPDAVARASDFRWAKRFPRCFRNISIASGAADQQELESFFGNFVPRSRVKESVNALLAARELNFLRVGNRN